MDVVALTDAREGDVLYWDRRLYRAQMVRDWGGFREIIAVLPTDADIADILTTEGAFATAFSGAFDALDAA